MQAGARRPWYRCQVALVPRSERMIRFELVLHRAWHVPGRLGHLRLLQVSLLCGLEEHLGKLSTTATYPNLLASSASSSRIGSSNRRRRNRFEVGSSKLPSLLAPVEYDVLWMVSEPWIRDLSEELFEIIEQRLCAIRQHRQRCVGTH